MLGNTPVQRTNLSLEDAKSFALQLSFVDAKGNPVDQTGGSITLTVDHPQHKGGGDALDVVGSIDGSKVLFEMQATDLDLEPDVYPYDITLVNADGYSIPVVKGELILGENTSEDTSNTYSGFDPSQELLVTMAGGNCVKVVLNAVPGIQGEQGPVGPKGDPTGVFIQPNQPGDPGAEPPHLPLWVDTDEDVSIVVDHGQQQGLADDDHQQYPLMYSQPASPGAPSPTDRPVLWWDTDEPEVRVSYPDATGQPSDKVPQTDGAAGWDFIDTPVGAPPGGTAGQALAKQSNADHDIGWSSFDPAGTAAAGDAAHVAAGDPHPQYLTQAEGDSTAAAAVAAHEAKPDPHPQYLLRDEAVAAWSALPPATTADVGRRIRVTGPGEWLVATVIADPTPRWVPAADSDTGWRVVSADLINGWTQSLLIRRTGNLVTTHGYLTGTGAAAVDFYTVPPGFASNVLLPVTTAVRVNTHATYIVRWSGSGLRMTDLDSPTTWPALSNLAFSLSWPTNDAWPTTLPGTPA